MTFQSLLDTTCTVEIKTGTTASALGRKTPVYSAAATVKTYRETVGGGEFRTPQKYDERTTHIFYMDRVSVADIFSAGATCRIVYDSENYNVIRVEEPRFHHLEIQAELVKHGNN